MVYHLFIVSVGVSSWVMASTRPSDRGAAVTLILLVLGSLLSSLVLKSRVGRVAVQLYSTYLVPVVSPSSSNSRAKDFGSVLEFSVRTLLVVPSVMPNTAVRKSFGNIAISRSPE